MLTLSGRLGISADARAHRYQESKGVEDKISLAIKFIKGLDFENLTLDDEEKLVVLINMELKNTPYYSAAYDLLSGSDEMDINFKNGLLEILSK